MNSSDKRRLEKFYHSCLALSERITQNRDALVKILCSYETYETANDEIDRTLSTLAGVRSEFSAISNPHKDLTIATFFPLNLPLYSLTLFGLIPSAFASKVFIRPPEVMLGILSTIWDALKINEDFTKVALTPSSRHIFVELYAAEADVLIFTGKYENALAVHRKCPSSLMLYNGSGVNPFIIFEDAEINLATQKAIEMRCFNSGQDCAGPDVFFVHSSIANDFSKKLQDGLDTIKVGDTGNKHVKVGPTIKISYLDQLYKIIEQEKSNVVRGGTIDRVNKLVTPTIIEKNVNDHDINYFHEFFAPVFYILRFDNEKDLKRVILSEKFRERGMYISIFGTNENIEPQLDFVKILRNKIVNDTEQGNQEYGGHGERANFLLYKDRFISGPVLLSRDLHRILK